MIRSRMAEHLGNCVFTAVCGEVVHQVGISVKDIKGTADVLLCIRPSDVGDYQAHAGVFLLYLRDLRKVHRVLQSAGAGDMEHDYRSDAVHDLKLFFRKEIENTYLAFRNV